MYAMSEAETIMHEPNKQYVMMVGISVVLTGMSYNDKDTTHIGVEFLKGKWKMFCKIWQNLQNDSIGWTCHFITH